MNYTPTSWEKIRKVTLSKEDGQIEPPMIVIDKSTKVTPLEEKVYISVSPGQDTKPHH